MDYWGQVAQPTLLRLNRERVINKSTCELTVRKINTKGTGIHRFSGQCTRSVLTSPGTPSYSQKTEQGLWTQSQETRDNCENSSSSLWWSLVTQVTQKIKGFNSDQMFILSESPLSLSTVLDNIIIFFFLLLFQKTVSLKREISMERVAC